MTEINSYSRIPSLYNGKENFFISYPALSVSHYDSKWTKTQSEKNLILYCENSIIKEAAVKTASDTDFNRMEINFLLPNTSKEE